MAMCPGIRTSSLSTRHLLGTGPILGESGKAPFYSAHAGFVYRLCSFLPGPSLCWHLAPTSARLRMQNKRGRTFSCKRLASPLLSSDLAQRRLELRSKNRGNLILDHEKSLQKPVYKRLGHALVSQRVQMELTFSPTATLRYPCQSLSLVRGSV